MEELGEGRKVEERKAEEKGEPAFALLRRERKEGLIARIIYRGEWGLRVVNGDKKERSGNP